MDAIAAGTIGDLESLSTIVDGFPRGKDDRWERYWITHAIDAGSLQAIQWMLSQQVALGFCDDEGYTVLLAAIELEKENKYEILELLLRYGAPTDIQGRNDWTALHMAAARNDVRSLEILLRYGADWSIRTRIDDFSTPLEEAQILGCEAAAAYLAKRV